MLVVLGALSLWRSRPSAKSPAAEASPATPPEAPLTTTAEAAPTSTREPMPTEVRPAPPTTLRGRVVTAEGAALASCQVAVTHAGQVVVYVRTDPAGRFEIPGPLRAGTVVTVRPEADLVAAPGSLELDSIPEEELVFVVRAGDAPQSQGLVRGVVVDELEGTPLAFAELHVDGERIETDSEGSFVTAELHGRGLLEFFVKPGGWEIEIDFDPARGDLLRVPARVGPTFYVEIDGSAESLAAYWVQDPPDPAAPAFPLSGMGCHLRRAAPSLVRLPRGDDRRVEGGELLFVSTSKFLAARAPLAPGTGTRTEPLQVRLRPYSHLQLELRFQGRSPEWHEELDLVLRSASGGPAVRLQGISSQQQIVSFVVFQSGAFVVQARLDGAPLAEQHVELLPDGPTFARLDVLLPERESPPEPEVEVERVSLVGRVESRANRPTRGSIRLTRKGDGEEDLLDLEWIKLDGRWSATFGGEVPSGELVASLELEPCYSATGPTVVQAPLQEDLRYVLNDDGPTIDVYLEPVADEDGSAVLAYEAMLLRDDGMIIEGTDFGSPTAPVITGHPCDVAFTWLCWAGGRGAASGRLAGQSVGGEVRVPVRLRRGWGVLLYVGGPSYLPLQGVEVLLDGVRHGTTGSHGYLALAAERPATITLRYEDWRLLDGDVRLDGSFDDSQPWINAHLGPPER